MRKEETTLARPSPITVPAPRASSESGAFRVSSELRTSGTQERAPGARWSRWVLLGFLLLAGLTLVGAPYYFAPFADRVRSPWHPWLRPSGYIGQSAGIVSLLIFLSLWLYPLRRRFRWLAFTGSMAKWLEAHVAFALLLPLLAAVHAGWRFTGLIGLGYDAMLAVWLSGIVGRYLYTRIPRGRSGLELDAGDVAKARHALVEEIAKRTRLKVEDVREILGDDPWPCEGLGVFATLRQLVRDDFARWRTTRTLGRVIARRAGGRVSRSVLKRIRQLARREMALMQQARMLGATQRLFRFWHVVHRPFAIAALAAVLIHVTVAVAMGATWAW